jgi:hypothetical protein
MGALDLNLPAHAASWFSSDVTAETGAPPRSYPAGGRSTPQPGASSPDDNRAARLAV